MPTIQVFDVKFDTTDDDGFESLSASEIKMLEDDIEGRIFEIDCDPKKDGLGQFDHLICEEITSETGWLVSSFDYRHILVDW